MKKGFKRRWIKVFTGMTSIMLIMPVVSMPTMAYEPPQGSQCSNSQPTKSFVVNPPGVVKLDELDKYMTIDENYKLHFDTKQAIKDSLPPRIIYFGLKAERVNNKMIYELKTYEEVSEETIREIETLYGPSFKIYLHSLWINIRLVLRLVVGAMTIRMTVLRGWILGFTGIHGTI